ncbi:HAD family phosphatase [Flavobacteriaceae bacterium]|jgi:2-haloacid dehalogenase|nr:hydrolase, haloacid dehalogenase-like family [uncultured bacterium]MDA9139447.1 HAD family phosphatase [Flavobacteriaceae bacterium]MDA9250499.1 HAD family phosphatase [Flavobacteriaceae bacterium]|tara:strand:+ start:4701 stop:5318 length:618 start_codon:yes stop_codon:yes gene_type:complete
MTEIKNVIFDLGGVLIDWNPEYVYLDVFNGDREKMKWFFDEICTMDWNENQDAGYPLEKATEERVKLFPEYEEWIRIYYGRWEEMLGNQIDGTVAILKQLIDNPNYKVVALTNWSAETFPVALERFDFLHWFEGIVVSGTEKMRKPFNEIYELTLNRFNIEAAQSLFIDDNARNIEAAKKMGINTIRFNNPTQLKSELKSLNIEV